MLTVTLTKCTPGEDFKDLDLTNRLLARTGEVVSEKGKGPPKIQVMSCLPSSEDTVPKDSAPDEAVNEYDRGVYDEALEFDFQLPQTLPEEEGKSSIAKYGFNNQYSSHFQHLQNPDILTISSPEDKTALERWQVMRDSEDAKFDREWYLADKYEPPPDLEEIMSYQLPSLDSPFTAEEQAQLQNLGRKECKFRVYLLFEFLVDDVVLIENEKDVYLNLPPLIFAILYDKMTTLSSSTSETPWTISRLSPSLSSLAPAYLPPTPSIPLSAYAPLKQIKMGLFRRVLTYPLYRHLPLAENVWRETARLVRSKRAVVRLLMEARGEFMEGDWSLYVRCVWEDYVIWAQGASEGVLQVLGAEMEKISVEEGEIGFDMGDPE